ncbi:MAG: nickel-responsive transcriptional regulator NikR [Candidatus Thorarchaeota archaeon]|jgi:CopG family nickel-responsive transcriptional regulator
MTELKRFGVSIPEDLLEEFDKIVNQKGYVGRSEAIRDAMRVYISQYEWESSQKGNMAALNIVYQHKPRLMGDLIRAQHQSDVQVHSTVHIHLTKSHCLEVLALEGTRAEIEKLTKKVGGLSGIEYVRLFAFSIHESGTFDHSH